MEIYASLIVLDPEATDEQKAIQQTTKTTKSHNRLGQ